MAEADLHDTEVTGQVDISSNCARLLGQLCVASGPIDPRAIRVLSFLVDKVDVTGSSITANAGTNLNTSLLALEAGGNLSTIAGKDFATQTTLALIKAKTDNLDVLLSTRTKPADNQNVTGTITTIQGIGTNLHTVVDSGTVTANAGTNLNTSTLALEAGGNLSLIKAKTDNLDVLLSTRTKPADQQHAIIDSGTLIVTQGTGTNLHTVVDSGTITEITNTVTITGTVTANAGTNLNTSLLATEATLSEFNNKVIPQTEGNVQRLVVIDDETQNLLTQILKELKKNNMYLAKIADEYIRNADIIND